MRVYNLLLLYFNNLLSFFYPFMTNTESNKEDGVTCPICFGEYTSSGEHRIASMKCGHLFGYSCILEWFGKRKMVLCPVCSSKCLKSQIRLIFSSRVVALNTETEHKLVEQYLNEFNAKNKLIEEVSRLKTEIDILKLNNKTECNCKSLKRELSLKMDFFTKIKVDEISNTSTILYDELNGYILLSIIRDNVPCLLKYFDSGIILKKTFNDSSHISHMKYIDGNVILSIGKVVYILNTYNSNIIFEDKIENRIASLGTNVKNRNKLLIGDDRGNVIFYTLGFSKRVIKICDVPIHSIFETGGCVYIGTVFNVYKLTLNVEWDDFVQSEEPPEIDVLNFKIEQMTCVNIFGEGNNIIIVFRNKHNKILHYLINEENVKVINLGLKQFVKYKEIFFKGCIYIVDETNNKIIVLGDNHEKQTEYLVNEKIISFDVKSDILLILTRQFIYVYK